MSENPVTRKISSVDLLLDRFALPTTGNWAWAGFLSLCFLALIQIDYPGFIRVLLEGLPVWLLSASFNRSLPARLSRAFSSAQIFAVCLPASSMAPGVASFNSPGPYYFSPRIIDVSKSLTYTELILGPKGADTQIYTWYESPDYYIGLTSIKVRQKFVVPLNKTLLAVDEHGRGGTKISSSTAYSVLQTSVFKAFVDAFVQESSALNLTLIAHVKPFSVCYVADNIRSTRLGPAVPTIDLVLGKKKKNKKKNKNFFWRIYETNSMVRIQSSDGVDAWGLGFIDGGLEPRTSIVIGGHQLRYNLLQFDLERQRLGFSCSLSVYGTTCAKFDSNSTRN